MEEKKYQKFSVKNFWRQILNDFFTDFLYLEPKKFMGQ